LSVISQLRQHEHDRTYSVFWIEDKAAIGVETSYNFYDWSGIFKAAWGDERHIGLGTGVYGKEMLEKGSRYFNELYLLRDFDPAGRQEMITLRMGPSFTSEWALVMSYWRYRFIDPTGLRKFLAGVVVLKMEPIEAINQRKR